MARHLTIKLVQKTTRRFALLASGIFVFLLLSALLYDAGMDVLEGRHRTFLQSLEWASETFTTTGYGADNHWSHPLMILLVIGVQFAGVLIIALIVPLILLPYLESRFEERVPREAGEISHHVVVYRFGPPVETLLQRLRTNNVPALVVETDETAARAVMESGQRVVFVRSDEDALDVCHLAEARALVVNGRDQENAALTLRARQKGFAGEIYAFVEEPAHRRPMELAGVTAAYTPRHIVAAALASHASDVISPRLPGLGAVAGLRRCELRVLPGSVAAGRTLGEIGVGAKSGAVVVGQWSRSRLQARCTAATRVEAGAILELVGPAEALEAACRILGAAPLRQRGPFLIAGFGEVGRKVHQLLTDAGEEVCVIEQRAVPGVDIVGNVLDTSVLERAGLAETRGAVLAVDSDDATLFATVVIRDTAPDVPVIARVNHARNLDNIYRAGADYALSISDISGEMLSAKLLRQHARVRDEQRSIVRVQARAARALRDLAVREFGCSILAVERSGAMLARLGADTRVEPGDELVLCGAADAVKSAAAAC
jgi:Trk K+ transport system NAD-binding subunit